MRRAVLLLLAAALLAGCTTPNPEGLHLSRRDFSALPGWRDAKLGASLAAFRRGCAVLWQRDARSPMDGAGYAGTVGDWLAACSDDDSDVRHFFETRFVPYAVAAGEDEGLFTGYYEPEIAGSYTRDGAYQTPVYGPPPDIIRADLGAFSGKLKGDRVAGRLDGPQLVPYGDRAAIDAGVITGAPILYTDDPVALFFLQIQGSGRVRLTDGSSRRLLYAGNNGQPYTAIGRTLIEQGELTRESVSLQTIRAWLKAHPDKARSVMETDKSYVFLREAPLDDAALGGIGTLGVALTPLASLAVDPAQHALGAPYYVVAGGDVTGLMIAQDTGGAIKGPVRGDVFFGFGSEAEDHAGTMKAPGRMFVLLPNELAARIGGHWTAP
jgi:membrane-bound lytic murein transglycosylase A